MASFSILDSYFVYQFVKRLVKPFNKWDAYKTGVIDENGEILVPEEKRTLEQKRSFKYYDLLVRNLKRALAKIPGGSSRIATYSAAVWLLREDFHNYDLEKLEENFFQYLKEEIAANNANPQFIAGLDEPPKFMGHRVFDVKRSTLHKCRYGKKPKERYKKYLDEEENSEEIRDYCLRNPNESIILRHNGEMIFLRRKPQTLNEDVSFRTLNSVESYLNQLYKKIGVGFDFSNHFEERINDPRNNPPINHKELLSYFGRFYLKYKELIKKLEPEEELLISDPKLKIWSPVVMKQGKLNRFLRVKTIMRKQNYQSDNFNNRKVVI